MWRPRWSDPPGPSALLVRAALLGCLWLTPHPAPLPLKVLTGESGGGGGAGARTLAVGSIPAFPIADSAQNRPVSVCIRRQIASARAYPEFARLRAQYLQEDTRPSCS